MSQQLHPAFSHESNTQRDTTEKLSDGELATITGGSAAQDAQKGAIGGGIVGGGLGTIVGVLHAEKSGYGVCGVVAGAVLGAASGGAFLAVDGAASGALGGAILKDKHHN